MKYILFGSGVRAERIVKAMPHIKFDYVIDNDKNKQGKYVTVADRQFLISSPDIFRSISLENCEIIIGSTYTAQMISQVRELTGDITKKHRLVKNIIFGPSHGNLQIYTVTFNDAVNLFCEFSRDEKTVAFCLGTEPTALRIHSLNINGKPSVDFGIIHSNGDWIDGDVLNFVCKNPNIYFGWEEGIETVSVNLEFIEPDYKAAYEFVNGYIEGLTDISNDVRPEFVAEEDFRQVEFGGADVKPIAYYLPQFHLTPENDEWWGKGFTEWTNVTKVYPLFEGHYQPHLPIDMGFYDLTNFEVQKRQIELAKKYGVYGFCYYYYHYKDAKLLELPMRRHLENKELDFPFCIFWANENWTRTWGGDYGTILMEIGNAENYYKEVIRGMMPFLRDSRYIRIDGKPVIIIYRLETLPNPLGFADIWREECRKAGVGEIFLMFPYDGVHKIAKELGFDAVNEFCPRWGRPQAENYKYRLYSANFSGSINNYGDFIDQNSNDGIAGSLYKGVFTNWDNTARHHERATVFVGSTPGKYKKWLKDVIGQSRLSQPLGDRYVFINAWNEWAEGAHLEPDRRYGYAYLKATREAVTEQNEDCGAEDERGVH